MACPKPSIKLFCSIDIIDSTSFKNKHLRNEYLSSEWFMFFKSFYDDVPIRLLKSYKNIDAISLKKEQKNGFHLPYQWKNLGDEIIFVIDINDFNHLNIHIEAFKKTIELFNQDKNKELKVKGTAWLAGFPVVNAILNHENYKPNTKKVIRPKHDVDFIGPSMDLGFRIAKYSTSRKFVISLDLAMILLFNLINKKERTFHFYFDKHQDAKGLNGGKYPIVWIDTLNSHDPIEDKLFGIQRQPSDYNLLYHYCHNFTYSKEKNILMPPFIPDSKHKIFKSSKKYNKSYKKVCKKIYNSSREDIKEKKVQEKKRTINSNEIVEILNSILKD